MLPWILLGFALALIPFVVIAVQASRAYPRLFADAHLDELASTLAQLKAAAASGHAESAITSVGLAVTWDATRPEVRISLRRGRLAAPAAAFFLTFAEALVALPEAAPAEQLREGGRFVLRFALAPEDAASFRDRPIALPSPDALATLRARAADAIRGPNRARTDAA